MRPFRAILLAIALLAPGPASALGEELPPGPTTIRPVARMPLGQATDQAEEAQSVLLTFAPGAWTPVHSHGGVTLVRVLEGEMTRRRGGAEDRFKAGEGWVETPGELHAAGNAGATSSRVLVTYLLTRGAPLTTVAGTPSQAPPPGPTTTFQSKRVPLGVAVTGFDDVATTQLGFRPGSWAPPHTHGGLTLVAVVDGEMTLRTGGRETVYRSGDLWVEPGAVHAAGNNAADDASVVVTYLLRRDAPVTTPAAQGAQATQAPAQLPRTGGAVGLGAVVAVSAASLLGAGLCLRRRAGPG